MDEIRTNGYHHIDNGGPEITLVTTIDEDGIKTTKMTLDTNYYGFPSISTVLDVYGDDNIAILEMYKKALSEHIAELKMRVK